ncbi:MAG: carbonic anhydrase [Candidatus Buchananbacteria bacterium]
MEPNKKVSIAVLCMDYRFWPDTLPLLEEKYGEFDLIEIAGGSKSLVLPLEPEDRITLLENISISIKLHHAERIILTNHIDCGAYGGSTKFKTHDKELAFHKEELEKAEMVIEKKFPELEVVKLIIYKNDKDEIKLIEV